MRTIVSIVTKVVCTRCRTVRAICRAVIALVATCGFAAAVSAQTTVTLSTPGTQINADLTIQGGSSGWTDFSGSDVLASKVSSSASYTRRIMMKFNTEDFIPANAVIQSAQLYLVLRGAGSSEGRPLTAYQVAKSFVTGQTNWYCFRSGQHWSSSGGDFGSSYGTTFVDSAVGSTYTFDLTDMVQHAVNGDFGSRYTRVALVDTGGSNSGSYREFYSTRASDPSVRPRLVITYGTSSAPPPSSPPPPPPSTGTTIRVMQWNIHKTRDSDGICNPDLIASIVVAQNAQVVSFNEVNFYSGVCAWTFDMGAKLESLLEQKTGVQWYRQSVNPNGVDNVLLSQFPPVSSSSTLLDYGRGVAQMGIVVNGRTVNLFSTHIEYDVASYRPIQISEALRWMTNFSEPRILMGDFNTWPNTDDYWLVASVYQDAWAMALNAGTASSYNGTGATHGASRFDYAFYSNNGISLKSVTVPDTTTSGVMPSDHDPVIAKFTVQ